MEWHHGAMGLVLPITHVGNLFHALPHAVPFADAYHALVAANKLSSLHVLPYAEPNFARRWPTVRGKQWGYWQIILGALGVPEGAWSREVANLNAHLGKGGFHCYPTVRGGHAPFCGTRVVRGLFCACVPSGTPSCLVFHRHGTTWAALEWARCSSH